MTTCPAALNIRGEHFECDWPSDENGKHAGWAHANRVSQAIWTDDREQFQPNESSDSTDQCPEWNCPDLSTEDRREGRRCAEHPCTCPEPTVQDHADGSE